MCEKPFKYLDKLSSALLSEGYRSPDYFCVVVPPLVCLEQGYPVSRMDGSNLPVSESIATESKSCFREVSTLFVLLMATMESVLTVR